MRRYLEESRAGATLAWAIGLLGLTLATVGVFGVFAYAVEERRREIGVRLALGAARNQIVSMLVSSSGRAMVLGLGAGLAAVARRADRCFAQLPVRPQPARSDCLRRMVTLLLVVAAAWRRWSRRAARAGWIPPSHCARTETASCGGASCHNLLQRLRARLRNRRLRRGPRRGASAPRRDEARRTGAPRGRSGGRPQRGTPRARQRHAHARGVARRLDRRRGSRASARTPGTPSARSRGSRCTRSPRSACSPWRSA